MRIYLDNCCYNRPYDDQSQLKINIEAQSKLEIQQQIRDGKLELASSYILELENRVNPFEMKKKSICQQQYGRGSSQKSRRNYEKRSKVDGCLSCSLCNTCRVSGVYDNG